MDVVIFTCSVVPLVVVVCSVVVLFVLKSPSGVGAGDASFSVTVLVFCKDTFAVILGSLLFVSLLFLQGEMRAPHPSLPQIPSTPSFGCAFVICIKGCTDTAEEISCFLTHQDLCSPLMLKLCIRPYGQL